MEIYKMYEEEGLRIARNVEQLRKEKRNNRDVVKCSGTISSEMRKFKKDFVLDNGVNNILSGAKDYFLVIDGDNARLCLVYQTCQVIYEFRSDNDWKNFGIEIAASDVCQDYSSCDTRPAGMIEAVAFIMIVKFAFTYGFSRVFDKTKTRQFSDLFTSVRESKIVVDNEFKAEEESREKIMLFLSHNAMQKEFADNYLYKHLSNWSPS